MSLSFILLAATAASPSALVVPDSDGARAAAAAVVRRLQEAKVSSRTTAAPACLTLEGTRRSACLAEAAAAAKADAIVVVSVAEVRDRVAVTLEALSRRGAPIPVPAASGLARDLDALVRDSVEKLAAAIRKLSPAPVKPVQPGPQDKLGGDPEPDPEPKPAPATPPPETDLKPARDPVASEQPPRVVEPEAPDAPVPAPSRVPAIAFTLGALATAIASVSFGAVTAKQRGQLYESTAGVSSLKYSQAQALSSSSNVHEAVAWSFGAAAVALLVVALWQWLAP